MRRGARAWRDLLGVATFVVACSSAWAAPASTGTVAPSDTDHAPFFVAGPQDVGLSIGYGNGTSITTSGRYEGNQVQELVWVAHWQIEFTRMPREPAWYKGVVSFRAEPTVLINFTPRTGVAGGIGGLFRYQLTCFGKTRPFFEAGAGIIGLDFDIRDQADGLAFIPTAGVGVVRRFGEHLSVQLTWRFQHISNAYTQSPNGGIDAFQYLLGAAWHL